MYAAEKRERGLTIRLVAHGGRSEETINFKGDICWNSEIDANGGERVDDGGRRQEGEAVWPEFIVKWKFGNAKASASSPQTRRAENGTVSLTKVEHFVKFVQKQRAKQRVLVTFKSKLNSMQKYK